MCIFDDTGIDEDDMCHNRYGKKDKTYKTPAGTIFRTQNNTVYASVHLIFMSTEPESVKLFTYLPFFMIREIAKNMF